MEYRSESWKLHELFVSTEDELVFGNLVTAIHSICYSTCRKPKLLSEVRDPGIHHLTPLLPEFGTMKSWKSVLRGTLCCHLFEKGQLSVRGFPDLIV